MNKNFLKIFSAMFITLVCKRLMQQVDLIMLAPMGELELASYSVPMSINIIDFAIYLSLAVVLSVRLSKITEKKVLINEVSNVFSLAIWLGLILCWASFYLYKFFIDIQVVDIQINILAKSVVGWCAVTIIPDSACLFLSIIAFITNHERGTTIIAMITIILDVFLNYLLAYKLNMGFDGIFAATFISRTIEVLLFIYLLRGLIVALKIRLLPNLLWAHRLYKQCMPEFFRIIAERGNIFIIYWLINRQDDVVAKLSVFSVASTLRLVLGMFLIAYTRSISIMLSKNFREFSVSAKSWVIRIAFYGLVVVLLISIIVLLTSTILARYVFDLNLPLSLDWWSAFASTFILVFSIDYIAMICRGVMNYLEKFKVTALFDFLTMWGILLPLISYGLFIGNPYVIWLSYALSSAVFISFIIIYLRKNNAA